MGEAEGPKYNSRVRELCLKGWCLYNRVHGVMFYVQMRSIPMPKRTPVRVWEIENANIIVWPSNYGNHKLYQSGKLEIITLLQYYEKYGISRFEDRARQISWWCGRWSPWTNQSKLVSFCHDTYRDKGKSRLEDHERLVYYEGEHFQTNKSWTFEIIKPSKLL